MNKEEIISKVKELNFPKGEYVVFGSCPMTIAGLRESNDIDMLISESLYEKLEEAGWEKINKGPNDTPLTKDIFELHNTWEFSTYSPSLEELLSDADIIDGIPFASLQHVRKWKEAWGRPKDVEDVKLIDKYLKNET